MVTSATGASGSGCGRGSKPPAGPWRRTAWSRCISDIDAYADGIARRIDEVLAATGTSLILVGHSMGGLASRAYLRRHGVAKVARLITLGSPHQGTRAGAAWAWGRMRARCASAQPVAARLGGAAAGGRRCRSTVATTTTCIRSKPVRRCRGRPTSPSAASATWAWRSRQACAQACCRRWRRPRLEVGRVRLGHRLNWNDRESHERIRLHRGGRRSRRLRRGGSAVGRPGGQRMPAGSRQGR
jgi:pimeloyl-ACP methyl ester carboxylesterase